MIVRLKEGLLSNLKASLFEFQFYDSPIKSMTKEDQKLLKDISFNSMIVRLKVVSI